MTFEWIVLVASLAMVFVLGALMGYGLAKRKIGARARRQAAAQLSLYRQLHDLQEQRQRPQRIRPRVGSFS
ncbi:MAG: hypothetical protein ACRDS0_07550 [Pseudonocardiaceae bacterium]